MGKKLKKTFFSKTNFFPKTTVNPLRKKRHSGKKKTFRQLLVDLLHLLFDKFWKYNKLYQGITNKTPPHPKPPPTFLGKFFSKILLPPDPPPPPPPSPGSLLLATLASPLQIELFLLTLL